MNIDRSMVRNFLRIIHSSPFQIVRYALLIIGTTSMAKVIQEYFNLESESSLLILIALFFAYGILVKKKLHDHSIFWIFITLFCGIYIVINWPGPGNHTYVFLYLTMTVAVTLIGVKTYRLQVLQTNTKYIFLVIMFFAAWQKLITPIYMDGTINAFWIVNGGYYQPVYHFFNGWSEIVNENYDQLNAYYNINSARTDAMYLQDPFENITFWGKMLSWLILASEIMVPGIFAFSRHSLVKHGALFIFILLVLITRLETGFLSLICIIGMAHSDQSDKYIRNTYLIIFGFLQLLFILDYGYI